MKQYYSIARVPLFQYIQLLLVAVIIGLAATSVVLAYETCASCGTGPCCRDQCYSEAIYVCTSSGRLCPKTAPNSCGSACYNPTDYHCDLSTNTLLWGAEEPQIPPPASSTTPQEPSPSSTLQEPYPSSTLQEPYPSGSTPTTPHSPALNCKNVLGQWMTGAVAPGRHMEGATAVMHNKLYIFTGWGTWNGFTLVPSNDTHVYDPQTNTWETKSKTPISASHVQAAAWLNPPSGQARYIYLVGGFIGNNLGTATNQVWRYDTLTDRWFRMPNLPEARASGGAVIDENHVLHYIGGLKADRNTDGNNHWTLDLTDPTATWGNATVFNRPRNHFQAIYLNGYIYASGGQQHHDTGPVDRRYCDRYNVTTDTWEQLANQPTPRSHAEPATIAINGRIMQFGGRDNQGPYGVLQTSVQYNPATNVWETSRNLPAPRIATFAGFFENITVKGVTGDYVVIALGGKDWNIFASETWISKVERTQCQ